MKRILHITPHLGGGVGTVIHDWVKADNENHHTVIHLDLLSEKTKVKFGRIPYSTPILQTSYFRTIKPLVSEADVVLIHYWDHPLLERLLFTHKFPPCRLVFWCHKNFDIPESDIAYPDLFMGTSPVQGLKRWIWSTGNIRRYHEAERKPRKYVNVGYVGTVDFKKMHSEFFTVCNKLNRDFRITLVGENKINTPLMLNGTYHFVGEVNDVLPYLKEMDIFLYLLRPDHYGTCEQAIGEAMAAGVAVVAFNNPAEGFIIEDCSTGLLVNGVEECVQQVNILGKSAILRDSLVTNAKKFALSRYNVADMIKTWNAIFNSLTQNTKTGKGRLR